MEIVKWALTPLFRGNILRSINHEEDFANIEAWLKNIIITFILFNQWAFNKNSYAVQQWLNRAEWHSLKYIC